MTAFRALLSLFTFAALAIPSAPPTLKLDDTVRPVRYDVDLTIIPGEKGFSGTVNIDVQLMEPSSLVWLNATALIFDEAVVRVTEHSYPAAVESGGPGFVALRLPNPIPAGMATLKIRYKGEIISGGHGGVIKSPDGGNVYVSTNFEPTDARRAFPCFDQPNFKTPWQLTLHVKNNQSAFGNAPQESETAEPNQMKAVRFKQTKPLPSYLVAFAVGPFEVVEAGTAGRNHTPLRIIVPKGKTEQASYAAEVTGPLLDRLEEYFGFPYPFEKLDSVSVPLARGAMENAGLITYSQTFILSDPKTDTDLRQWEYAGNAAHEMAHEWFGDLVTMYWWDDTWLNEPFATWMSSKIIALHGSLIGTPAWMISTSSLTRLNWTCWLRPAGFGSRLNLQAISRARSTILPTRKVRQSSGCSRRGLAKPCSRRESADI